MLIQRRRFLAGLAGSLLAAPFVARSGVLMPVRAVSVPRVVAIYDGLRLAPVKVEGGLYVYDMYHNDITEQFRREFFGRDAQFVREINASKPKPWRVVKRIQVIS